MCLSVTCTNCSLASIADDPGAFQITASSACVIAFVAAAPQHHYHHHIRVYQHQTNQLCCTTKDLASASHNCLHRPGDGFDTIAVWPMSTTLLRITTTSCSTSFAQRLWTWTSASYSFVFVLFYEVVVVPQEPPKRTLLLDKGQISAGKLLDMQQHHPHHQLRIEIEPLAKIGMPQVMQLQCTVITKALRCHQSSVSAATSAVAHLIQSLAEVDISQTI